ncbi:hypothetical protein IFM89_003449 [Coptis chinensis]|uniref:Sodium/calcium exchanger membrane region domain-containing protein n=1 Tax=Coptis chinensis TaxID=261450 RepID=A0A835HCB5_9MAGN|nr:hypothetical protein IFM89_003449 [Coptis chinensis]
MLRATTFISTMVTKLSYPVLGYTVLFLWLAILFYVLGNTAANYFCSSLESLSRVLRLSPTIAGVTLLSLGNGANDVFASLVSFMGNGTGGIGLNSVLGGVFFISCIIVGVICIAMGRREVIVDRSSFIRDVLFLLLSLCSLLVILIVGKINIWGAICFLSIYFVYVFAVSTTYFCRNRNEEENLDNVCHILPISTKNFFGVAPGEGEFGTPLLGYVDEEKPISTNKTDTVADDDQKAKTRCFSLDSTSCFYLHQLFYILELPLYLPRRLTIPVVSEDRWSKPCAVISVTLAPILLAVLWNSHSGNMNTKISLVINLTSALVGVIFGTVAFVSTKRSSPPKRCLLPWLIGGFLMSIAWSYIIAEELVSLLVSLGHIFGISPSILGLTLLAWGNSLGDLIGNVTMAINGGPYGVQVAISGCYAGPIFNTTVGLGLSLVFSCWSEYPSSYVITKDPSLYETLAFLMSGLLWALVILPRRNMKLDRTLGAGLLAIYLCFLFVRLAQTLGLAGEPTPTGTDPQKATLDCDKEIVENNLLESGCFGPTQLMHLELYPKHREMAELTRVKASCNYNNANFCAEPQFTSTGLKFELYNAKNRIFPKPIAERPLQESQVISPTEPPRGHYLFLIRNSFNEGELYTSMKGPNDDGYNPGLPGTSQIETSTPNVVPLVDLTTQFEGREAKQLNQFKRQEISQEKLLILMKTIPKSILKWWTTIIGKESSGARLH